MHRLLHSAAVNSKWRESWAMFLLNPYWSLFPMSSQYCVVWRFFCTFTIPLQALSTWAKARGSEDVRTGATISSSPTTIDLRCCEPKATRSVSHSTGDNSVRQRFRHVLSRREEMSYIGSRAEEWFWGRILDRFRRL